MESFDEKTSTQAGSANLQAQCEALQHLTVSMLVLVLVISGTLTIYLLRQWVWAKRDLAAIRPQAKQVIAEYQRVSEPLMNTFVKKITDYGRTHPEFAPILAKYNLKPAATASTPATGMTPAAPATKAPAPKK
jgi:hypothetical protein